MDSLRLIAIVAVRTSGLDSFDSSISHRSIDLVQHVLAGFDSAFLEAGAR
jgi:hypothetical protein